MSYQMTIFGIISGPSREEIVRRKADASILRFELQYLGRVDMHIISLLEYQYDGKIVIHGSGEITSGWIFKKKESVHFRIEYYPDSESFKGTARQI